MKIHIIKPIQKYGQYYTHATSQRYQPCRVGMCHHYSSQNRWRPHVTRHLGELSGCSRPTRLMLQLLLLHVAGGFMTRGRLDH